MPDTVDLDLLEDKKIATLLKKVVKHIIDEEKSESYEQDIARTIEMEATKFNRFKNFNKYESVTEERKKERLSTLKKVLQFYSLKITGEGRVADCPPRENPRLRALANGLALNLIDVSTSFGEKNEPHEQIIANEEALRDRRESQKRERFVLLVGAGASYAATNRYIPLAEEGVRRIREKLEKRVPKDLIDEELERLKYSFRLDPEDFETKILAYSRFSRREVVNALREICGYAYIPSLSYEILAHMLKHRYIDLILNFNYDEVLDVAVKEELHDGDFKFIYSDADCPANYEELLVNNRLRQPVYIKPHGTISHRSSLRFTREDYFSLPPEIRQTIKDLIDARIKGWTDRTHLPLNIIIIGYRLQNFELVELLREYLNDWDRAIKLWVFDISPQFKTFEDQVSPENRERIDIEFFNLNKYSLSEHLLDLWGLIEDNFEDNYRPRGIERHQLVNNIFQFSAEDLESLTKGKRVEEKQQKYFLARFYVELIISLLQSDGILNATQIMEDRAGKYFNLYLEKGGKDRSLVDHARKIGLKVYKGFVWDTFTLEDPNLFYEKEKLYQTLYDNLLKCLRLVDHHYKLVEGRNKEEFSNLARLIRRRNVAKITPNFIFPHNHLFSNIGEGNILNTTLGWVYRFQKAIRRNESWDLMLSISEKGRFLNNCIRDNLLEGKKVELVLSSFDSPGFKDIRDPNELDKLDLLSGEPLLLPWWLHNRHMVLLMKKTSDRGKSWERKWKLVEGFYYENRMLSRRVNPIHLKKDEDDGNLRILLSIFANYWYRARVYSRQSRDNERYIPIIKDDMEMEERIEELLSLFDS